MKRSSSHCQRCQKCSASHTVSVFSKGCRVYLYLCASCYRIGFGRTESSEPVRTVSVVL